MLVKGENHLTMYAVFIYKSSYTDFLFPRRFFSSHVIVVINQGRKMNASMVALLFLSLSLFLFFRSFCLDIRRKEKDKIELYSEWNKRSFVLHILPFLE